MKEILENLQKTIPKKNFRQQPQDSKKCLIELEKYWETNTSDFLLGVIVNEKIPKDVADFWIMSLDTFISFGGAIEELNHLK